MWIEFIFWYVYSFWSVFGGFVQRALSSELIGCPMLINENMNSISEFYSLFSLCINLLQKSIKNRSQSQQDGAIRAKSDFFFLCSPFSILQCSTNPYLSYQNYTFGMCECVFYMNRPLIHVTQSHWTIYLMMFCHE